MTEKKEIQDTLFGYPIIYKDHITDIDPTMLVLGSWEDAYLPKRFTIYQPNEHGADIAIAKGRIKWRDDGDNYRGKLIFEN